MTTDAFVTDFVATGHDETLLLHPVTPAAREWARAHLGDAACVGAARAVPSGGLAALADALQADGLTLIDGRVRPGRTNGTAR